MAESSTAAAPPAGKTVAVAAATAIPTTAIVHPLVLLSATDHYMRVAKDTKKRVVGVLLGSKEVAGERDTWKTTTHENAYSAANTVNVTNSFAIPFEEDDKDPTIWFVDHNYLESMFAMFKKVNARERIVGWYSTGPKIRVADLEINEVFKKYVKNPVFVIIDVQPHDDGIPTDAYVAVEEVHDDGTPTRRSFVHLESEIGAEEAEEIGVEHLLRDIKDTTVSTLAERVSAKLVSLKGLQARLEDIHAYLKQVQEGKMPVNHEITFLMQEIFNLLPNLNVEELVRSFSVKTNDMMLVIYISSLIRSVIALHNLINNKINLKDAENDEGKDKDKTDKEKKDKETKETKETKEKDSKEKDVEMKDTTKK